MHVQTLRALCEVNTAFLDTVRRVCRDAVEEIPHEHRVIPCPRDHYDSICTFELAATWMPISVMASVFHLNIFEPIKDTEKLMGRTQSLKFLPNMNALVLLLWNRMAMERISGVPRINIYLPFTKSSATHNPLRSINNVNVVLNALEGCQYLHFSYIKISMPALHCDARKLLEAVKIIAPTRYLEINLQILGWGDTGEHPALPGFTAKLAIEMLTAGLSRGASRVDIQGFRTDDQQIRAREISHSGSLVNFIRARNLPNGVVVSPAGSVFGQFNVTGQLDLGHTKGPVRGSGKGGMVGEALWEKNRVVINPFGYTLTAVVDGQREWMGDSERFSGSHFWNLALRDEDHVRTAEGRRLEELLEREEAEEFEEDGRI